MPTSSPALPPKRSNSMSFFERLIGETRTEREAFIAIPVIQRALRHGVPMAMYLAFLGQAYHHVRHTCRLLASAAARCTDADARYITALLEYIGEERGHIRSEEPTSELQSLMRIS